MKTKRVNILLVLMFTLAWIGLALGDSSGDLFERFSQEFNELQPPPNSPIDSDYKITQTALGTFYTTQALGLIYSQNQEMLTRQEAALQKYDEMIYRYDLLLEQNRQIIELLSTLANEKSDSQEP